jgi:PilZ domain-containing protein
MIDEHELVDGDTFQVSLQWGKRRTSPRYPLEAPVAYFVKGAPQPVIESGLARDISLGGVGLLPPHSGESVPAVGAIVQMRFMAEGIGQPLRLEGMVVHASAESGIGVKFPRLPADMRMRLKRMLTMMAVH